MTSLTFDSARSENGGTEDPHLSIFVAEDEPAEPFALLFRASLPVEDAHVLAPADDAERVDFRGEASRQLAVRELVARHDLIHRKRERTGEVLRKLSVGAFVRVSDE